MQYTEIIKLLDAGYTRDEILKMEEPKQEESKQNEPKQEESKQEEPPKQKEPKQDETMTAALDELKSLFSDMKKEFTAMNIMNSRRDDEVRTGDDVIAAIINPPKKNKKEGK